MDNKILTLILMICLSISCHDLEDLNVNPNGVDPANADPNLLVPTVITGVAKNVVSLGFGDIAGVMQHTQKDGWSSGHNDYDWDTNTKSWSSYYDILRNNEAMYTKALENGWDFHQGVALVMKAYTYGLITDLWGDAPYSEALQGSENPDFFKPRFDDQAEIYAGILADLEMANTFLSSGSLEGIDASQDVLYAGDALKWRKFANSVALRYYMRLSTKDPGTAQAGISKITGNPGTYPLILNADDDAKVAYPGNTPENSWPSNTVFDESTSGSYFRIKMCATLVDAMQALNDPRLAIWANKIQYPIVLDANAPDDTDMIVEGKRVVSQNIIDAYIASWQTTVDYDEDYVGIPPSTFAASQYNLNPNLEQGVFNPHASQLNDRYKQTSGPLLAARLMSAAEVRFILAEAALKGWASGTPSSHYNAGVQQSLNAWGIGATYASYIAGAPYAGLEEIMEQKWIASWSAAAESWFDYRRTGLPNFQTGESAKRQALPLRFYYHFNDEINLNSENAEEAISKLEATAFKGDDNTNNSAWSKIWLLQGTNKPY